MASASDEEEDEEDDDESKTDERILTAPVAILRVAGKMTPVSQLGLSCGGCVLGLLRLSVTISPSDRDSTARPEPETVAIRTASWDRE